jgi:hypothetical protein
MSQIVACRLRTAAARGHDAALSVIVDQAHRLHENIDAGGADERPVIPIS